MTSRRVAVRLLIPAATLIAERGDLKCKPSELPIYTPETPKDQQQIKSIRDPGAVEQQIGNVRRQIVSFTSQVGQIQEKAEYFYEDSINQIDWLIKYLREEDNTTPRAGAIAVGGLAGFILGLRGGFFRRVLFTSAGALGMAALCYPKDAAYYADISRTESKRYLKIAYNFYHGEQELPEVNMAELAQIENEKLLLAEIDNDDDEPPEPEKVVSHIHTKANKENCHCPIGTCLNPQDEVPPNHPSKVH